MRFLDLFAGIGGFRLGMERAGHICVGHCEKDPFAIKSYNAIHQPKEEEWSATDITEVSDEEWRGLRGTVDVICAGFPCQAFSIAGRRGGFSDTRGTMFFEVARAAKQIQPRFLFLENVKGLLSHDQGQTFATILATLDELGYDAEWQVLNSKNFGVPQNRERVFIIGHIRGECGREIFPLVSDGSVFDLSNESNESQSQTELCTTIGTRFGSRADDTFVITKDDEIRKLTPRECWRLQGFPDWAFDRAKATGMSDTQLYKQVGNSVTVNVIEEIARKLLEGTENE